jgi:hypothetical protein
VKILVKWGVQKATTISVAVYGSYGYLEFLVISGYRQGGGWVGEVANEILAGSEMLVGFTIFVKSM